MTYKMKFGLEYVLLLFTVCLGLIGCSANVETNERSDNTNIDETTENSKVQITDNEYDENDYAELEGKTWIAYVETEAEESLVCSFYVTDISDGNIAGRFSVGEIARKGYYQKGNENVLKEMPYLGSFSGEMVDNTATCNFYDNRGIGGKIKIIFLENENIKMEIDCKESMSFRNSVTKSYYSGTYIFHTWNLSKETSFSKQNQHLSGEKMKLQGKDVLIVGGEMEVEKEKYPCVFLTDLKGNILYQFDLGCFSGTELSGVEVEDKDGNGLKDISINLRVCEMEEGEEKENVETGIQWIFYQKNDGSFIRERRDILAKEVESVQSGGYDNLLQKIWITETTEMEKSVYDIPFSFYFSNIENGNVEGRFCYGGVVEKDCRKIDEQFDLYEYLYMGYFSGDILNGIIECKFVDGQGNKGEFIITGWDNDRISATIRMVDVSVSNNNLLSEEEYSFRNLNLSTLMNNSRTNFEVDSTTPFAYGAALDEMVELVVGKITDVEKGNYSPCAYLIDSKENILYTFDTGYQIGAEIVDASIEDINKDGLEDVHISMKFTFGMTEAIDESDNNVFERTYYQQENGLFLYEVSESK